MRRPALRDGADAPSGPASQSPTRGHPAFRSCPGPGDRTVFTKARGRVRGFLRGTSADPDPLLVITPDGVVEYVDSKKPVAVVDFDSLSGINLRVSP